MIKADKLSFAKADPDCIKHVFNKKEPTQQAPCCPEAVRRVSKSAKVAVEERVLLEELLWVIFQFIVSNYYDAANLSDWLGLA